jgi:regulator of ribonuclease activity A
MDFSTADLCDAFPGGVQVAYPLFHDYGGIERFAGAVETVWVQDDNTLVRESLESPGAGRVLVVDGGGSLKCALVGGRLAGLAESNGWAGLIVNGCVRDVLETRQAQVGIRALNSMPMRSQKNGKGERGGQVSFAGVIFAPGRFVYVDRDGIVVAERDLLNS